MSNPDPALITDQMWKLWTDCPITAAKLSGIYANKRAYHNTVIANLKTWPGNYSIKLGLDLPSINRDKARAIDLTMTPADMITWTKRMKASALDPHDNRLAAVREFYGTLDGKTVYGLIKDNEDGPWRESSADNTHLWHGHKSIFTIFVANWLKLAPILSVEAGETLAEWTVQTMLPKFGDTGEDVSYWQNLHNVVAPSLSLTTIDVDGNYGAATAAAFSSFYKKIRSSGTYDGHVMSGWMAVQYHQAFVKAIAPEATPPTPVLSEEQIKGLVNSWLAENVHGQLVITGDIDGKVILP